ncbi:MAG: ABC transporter permease [Chloroflexota bacterium]|nr:ABC transporter permease [Chloroflexota bacterium]
MAILVLLLVVAAIAPWIEPYPPLETSTRETLVPPFWYAEGSAKYLLGTDGSGRDVLSRIIQSTRITVAIVGISLGISIVVGTTLGLIAGYYGGWVDEVIMRFLDMWSSLPVLLVVLTIVMVMGQGFAVLIGSLALITWPQPVRLVRVEALRLRSQDYVNLAQVAGASKGRILYRHILPGVVNTVVVVATLRAGTLILTEATLSFLGAGVPPPNPSWGAMIADGRDYIQEAWWITVMPGIALLLVVMAGNFLGDWLRDHFDPRLRQV